MKKFVLSLLIIVSLSTNAQVGIGVAATDVAPSAQLEVKSTTKGLLTPRMTEAQKLAISSPATGLLVYQTDGTSGFYYYDGSVWKQGLGPQGVAGTAGQSGQTNTTLLYNTSSIYADGTAPADAPSSVTSTYGNFGWYFKKSGNSKINWYLQPKSSTMKVIDLTGLYLELFNVAITNASDMPYIMVYTKKTGSGDAASWYKSRRMYTFSGVPTANTKYLGFANLGANTPNTYNTSLLDMVAGLTTGTFAGTEDILFIVIASSSAATTCEFVANKLGVITGTSTQEFLFMPPSSIANLSGYATTAALDAEVLRAQTAEATLTSSVNNLSNSVTENAMQISQEASRAQVAEATLTSSLANKANIASPSFTGIVTVGGESSSSSAVVEVSSTTQGFLPPRMTAAQRDAISSPAAGLVLWCTNCGAKGELNVYNGTQWTNMVGGTVSATPVDLTPRVTIGTQVWTTQNLNVSTYLNGDPIPKVENSSTWASLTTGAYCYYNNDSATYAAIYGKLYNWYAVHDSRGLAPVGYHIPTDAEWTTLTTTLGGESVAGGKMKESGTSHWFSPNTGADNSSGFIALPAGYRTDNGGFTNIGNNIAFNSFTEVDPTGSYIRLLSSSNASVSRNTYIKTGGFSVRLVHD